jgi:hypothetical protein
MIVFLTLFAGLSFVCHGVPMFTRHVVQNYTTSVGTKSYTLVAYPLDICVNYEVGLNGFIKYAYFGKYSCTDLATDDWQVNLQQYTDLTCDTTQGDPVSVALTADAAPAGTFGAFYCPSDGVESYAITDGCTVSAAATEPAVGDDGGFVPCCQEYSMEIAACSPTTFAMGVCIAGVSDGNPIRTTTTCNPDSAPDGTYLSVHSPVDVDCSASPIAQPITTAVRDACSFRERATLDVYTRMIECVLVGVDQGNDTYCPPPTPLPTANPVPPTAAPVVVIASTAEDDAEPTEDNGVAVLRYVMAILASVAIYLVQ